MVIMKTSFSKDVIRDIKKSKGRFFSIVAIIALGVAFFSGIKTSPINMKLTADKYYDDCNFMDLVTYSTLGFTDKDIEEIKKVPGVLDVSATYSMDVLINNNNSEFVLKAIGIPLDSENYVNKYKLVEGRMPEAENECVVEDYKLEKLDLNIGDTINLTSGTDKDLNEDLKNSEYTIVGKVQTPNYLSFEKGSSKIGDGKISSFVCISLSNFKSDVFTEAYLTVEGAKELNTYEDEYFNLVNEAKVELEKLGEHQSKERYDSLVSDIKNEIKENNSYLPSEILEEIQDKAIEEIPDSKWIVLNREEGNYSYIDYKNNADSIDKLAKVFPVFFFLVAALVCLTTMTRMIDEQRITIGTLKALGYSKYKIASKYIVYSFSASFIGSIIGLSIGCTLLPIVVFYSYGIMYTLPKMEFGFSFSIAFSITLISILVTTVSSIFACYKELLEAPSSLMRPKPPKNGKRILLENVSFIWDNIGFISKVTIRNIFRYKKRFLMTVFGISGCTALLVTGYGIKDSITTIVDKQFGDIFKYNLTISIDNNLDSDLKEKALEDLKNTSEINNFIFTHFESANVKFNNISKDITIISVEDTNKINKFISFNDRKTKENYSLKDEGVIITEKIANQAKIKAGDEIIVHIDDKDYKLVVSNIVENYTQNYIYISDEYYKEIFNKEPNYTSILAITKENTDNESLTSNLIKNDYIKSVSFNDDLKENFDNIIKNLDYVILIMIISAGSLAFVVLYNLTNVNISERIREIATIKVLGFYNNEVAAYIYRENIILTLFGIIVGEFLGIYLHKFIMTTVELDSMMFGRNINIKSFVFSALLTIAFSIVVNIIMYYKLKGVKMVESLKSVD